MTQELNHVSHLAQEAARTAGPKLMARNRSQLVLATASSRLNNVSEDDLSVFDRATGANRAGRRWSDFDGYQAGVVAAGPDLQGKLVSFLSKGVSGPELEVTDAS